MAQNNSSSGWAGWVFFAGIMMAIIGALHAITGLAALLKDSYYVVGQEALVALDYTQWGWVHLLAGAVIFSAGIAVMNGSAWGRVVGVVMASVSLVANMAFLNAQPFWSILVILIDVLVIYALLVHGDDVRE